jgi:hypothetical protein
MSCGYFSLSPGYLPVQIWYKWMTACRSRAARPSIGKRQKRTKRSSWGFALVRRSNRRRLSTVLFPGGHHDTAETHPGRASGTRVQVPHGAFHTRRQRDRRYSQEAVNAAGERPDARCGPHTLVAVERTATRFLNPSRAGPECLPVGFLDCRSRLSSSWPASGSLSDAYDQDMMHSGSPPALSVRVTGARSRRGTSGVD